MTRVRVIQTGERILKSGLRAVKASAAQAFASTERLSVFEFNSDYYQHFMRVSAHDLNSRAINLVRCYNFLCCATNERHPEREGGREAPCSIDKVKTQFDEQSLD
jgi:hypothetical protein